MSEEEQKDEKPAKVTYKLKYPVKWGSETIAEIELGRLKGKDIKAMNKNSIMGDLMKLAAKSAKQPNSLFDEMDAEDVLEINEIVGDFLGAGQETGETS